MAKQVNSNGSNGHNGSDDRVYTIPDVLETSKGTKIRLIGLNPARLEKLQKAGKMPDVPYREIPNDLGDSQKEYLSENDLQNDEERAAWAEYKEKVNIVETKRSENVLKYVFTDGFEPLDMSDMEEWKRLEVEEYGLELPESPVQLKMDYINAKVIGTADDLGNIMAGVLERTGVPAEMLGEIRDSFRGTVRQSTPVETTEE
jgi:hypothetical protein